MESAKNSTRNLLKSNDTFVGKYEMVTSDNQMINILCKSDQKCILSVEHSSDNRNSDYIDSYNIIAGMGKSVEVPVRGKYFRLKIYNNSEYDQTYMRCHCFLSNCTKMVAFPNNCLSFSLFENTFVEDMMFSSSVDLQFTDKVTIIGTCNGLFKIIVQASPNDISWFDTNITFDVNSEDYYYTFNFLCQYMRLKVISSKKNITSYICAKR